MRNGNWKFKSFFFFKKAHLCLLAVRKIHPGVSSSSLTLTSFLGRSFFFFGFSCKQLWPCLSYKPLSWIFKAQELLILLHLLFPPLLLVPLILLLPPYLPLLLYPFLFISFFTILNIICPFRIQFNDESQ